MALNIIDVGPRAVIPTMKDGWQGANTGLYYHEDNYAWYLRPEPSRWHQCQIVSLGITAPGFQRDAIFRCPCGSYAQARVMGSWEPGYSLVVDSPFDWAARNSRRRGRYHFLTLM